MDAPKEANGLVAAADAMDAIRKERVESSATDLKRKGEGEVDEVPGRRDNCDAAAASAIKLC